MQLQEGAEKLEDAGIKVVGISYDATDILAKFTADNKITFPLLADPESKIIRQFRLLNEAGKAGTRNAGLAHPMIVIVGQDHLVKGTLEETIRNRHTGDQLVAAWKKINDGPENR